MRNRLNGRNCLSQIMWGKPQHLHLFVFSPNQYSYFWSICKYFCSFCLNMEKLQTLLWLSFLVVANIEVCPGGGSRLCRWSSKCRHKFTYWATDFKSRTDNFLILHFLDRSLTVYRLVGNRADLCEEAIAEQYWAALLFIGNFSDFAEHRFIGKLSDCGFTLSPFSIKTLFSSDKRSNIINKDRNVQFVYFHAVRPVFFYCFVQFVCL